MCTAGWSAVQGKRSCRRGELKECDAAGRRREGAIDDSTTRQQWNRWQPVVAVGTAMGLETRTK